jgi:hypothetical protein
MTPTEVIAAANPTGTHREKVAQKRAAIRDWLATDDGAAYLSALRDGTAGQDPANSIVLDEAGLRDPQAASLTRSARGTWARQIGGRAYALTAAECVAAGRAPGPGND